MNKMKLVDRLRTPQTMSKFTGTAERMLAADEIERLTAARDALRAEVEALQGQEPALYVQSNHFANAKFTPFLARICQQPMDQIHAVPLYLAAGAKSVPAGWKLVPKTITAQMEAVYSNDSGAYQTAQELHDAMLLAAGTQNATDVCEWREEDDFGWHTSCGATWSFFDGGPNDNGVKFCHGCGRPILVATEQEDSQ